MRATTLLLVALTMLAACARDRSLHSTLDENGRTWMGPDVVVTLARSAPRFSTAARDYLYLAPFETNSMGVRRQFLWVGLASTVDRAGRSAAPSEAATLILSVDGVPLTLELAPWEESAPAPRLSTPAPLYRVLRARVTRDQLERIAGAQLVNVEIATAARALEAYEPWQGAWSDWLAFLAPEQSSGAPTARATPP